MASDLKNKIELYDSLIIIFMALLTNVFSEFLSWLFIYRTKKYKECKRQIDTLNKKIDAAKENFRSKGRQDKKLKQQESDLKSLNMEMMKVLIVIINLDPYDHHLHHRPLRGLLPVAVQQHLPGHRRCQVALRTLLNDGLRLASGHPL